MAETRSFKALVAGLKLAPLFVLAGCSVFGGSTGPSAPRAGVAVLPEGLEDAICQGRAQEAVDALTAEPLVSVSDQFFTALALEEAGKATRARLVYAGVMQSGSNDIVRARCPGRTLADGPVMDEAAKRLAALSQTLAALDVDLAPSTVLHDGLPSSGPVRAVDPVRFSGGPPRAVARPASQSPLGQWFVHLASYRSMDNAMRNKSTLERRFPALAGLIDQWELDVSGSLAIRLGIRVDNRTDADTLCAEVKSQQEYCAVIDTAQ